MDSMYFILKSVFVTFVIVLLMQIKWSEHTLEYEAHRYLTSSVVVKPFESTAQGAVTFIRNMWNKVTKSLNSNFSNALRSENRPGSRFPEALERSKEYVKEKAKKAERAVDVDRSSARSTDDDDMIEEEVER